MPKPLRRIVVALLMLLGFAGMSGLAWANAVQPRAYVVPSGSMEPTLHVGDRVVAVSGEAERGSVVVFRSDGTGPGGGSRLMIKRVVGVPGDLLESVDGTLYVNGRPVAEPYLAPGARTDGVTRTFVPAGQYYVLGDNRERSADSRHHGTVAEDRIVKIVRWVVLPPGHAGPVD